MQDHRHELATSIGSLSGAARYGILVAAFLGWFCAGIQMAITSLAMRPAAIDLLARSGSLDLERFNEFNQRVGQKNVHQVGALAENEKALLTEWKAAAAKWFAWYQCAFLFGAAAGGLVFGRLGDRIGRSKAMALSILCYSIFSGAAYFAQTPEQLLLLRFVTCLGVGGMWPNGVALVSEAWSNLSRPLAAGVIGTSANIGILLFGMLAGRYDIAPDDWRWVMLVGAVPVLLGLIVLATLPESPRWLATRDERVAVDRTVTSTGEVFRPPFLSVTLIGIVLATIPLIGGWGSSNWMIPWAGEAGEIADPPESVPEGPRHSSPRDHRNYRQPVRRMGWQRPGPSPLVLSRERCRAVLPSTRSGSRCRPTTRSYIGWRHSDSSAASISVGCLCSCRSCFRRAFAQRDRASASTSAAF